MSLKDVNGIRYLEYVEDTSKTNNGGLAQRKIKRKVVKAYANDDYQERCPVRIYEAYLSHCPEGQIEGNPFYLRPLSSPSSSIWYYKAAAGRDTLAGVVGRIMKKAGYQGHFTNHSLRATCATRLYNRSVPEQLIQETTGHRSTDGVRSYKRSSEEQKMETNKLVRCDPPASGRLPGSASASSPPVVSVPPPAASIVPKSPSVVSVGLPPPPPAAAAGAASIQPKSLSVKFGGASVDLSFI